MTSLGQSQFILSAKYKEPGMGRAAISTFAFLLLVLLTMNGENFFVAILIIIPILIFSGFTLLAYWLNTKEVWFENGRLLVKSKPWPFSLRRINVEIAGIDHAKVFINKHKKAPTYKLGVVMVDEEEIELLPVYELNHAEELAKTLNNALKETKSYSY
jgi:hypothetical protein